MSKLESTRGAVALPRALPPQKTQIAPPPGGVDSDVETLTTLYQESHGDLRARYRFVTTWSEIVPKPRRKSYQYELLKEPEATRSTRHNLDALPRKMQKQLAGAKLILCDVGGVLFPKRPEMHCAVPFTNNALESVGEKARSAQDILAAYLAASRVFVPRHPEYYDQDQARDKRALTRDDWVEHNLLVAEHLGVARKQREAFAQVLEDAWQARCHEFRPSTREALRYLKAQGKLLGVLSNCVRTRKKEFEAHGILDFFEKDIFFQSFEEGVAKPDEAFFQRAIEAAWRRGILPEQIVMVGDRVEPDVAPSMRLGLSCIQVKALGAFTDTHPQVRAFGDLKGLFEALGWGRQPGLRKAWSDCMLELSSEHSRIMDGGNVTVRPSANPPQLR